MIRTRFILDWYNSNATRYPFRLFDFHRQLLSEGLFDAYNHWLFGPVENLAAYDNWIKTHTEEYNNFSAFQKTRIFRMPHGQYYQVLWFRRKKFTAEAGRTLRLSQRYFATQKLYINSGVQIFRTKWEILYLFPLRIELSFRTKWGSLYLRILYSKFLPFLPGGIKPLFFSNSVYFLCVLCSFADFVCRTLRAWKN